MTKAKVKARKTGASKMSMGTASIVRAKAETRPLPLDVAADINIDAARSSQSHTTHDTDIKGTERRGRGKGGEWAGLRRVLVDEGVGVGVGRR